MFELRETGDWDIFLGPPERARAVTSASLRYPLSVFNKNSTPKPLSDLKKKFVKKGENGMPVSDLKKIRKMRRHGKVRKNERKLN